MKYVLIVTMLDINTKVTAPLWLFFVLIVTMLDINNQLLLNGNTVTGVLIVTILDR